MGPIGIYIHITHYTIHLRGLENASRDQAGEIAFLHQHLIVTHRTTIGHQQGTVDITFDCRLFRTVSKEEFVETTHMFAGLDRTILTKILRKSQHQAFTLIQHVDLFTLSFSITKRQPYGT